MSATKTKVPRSGEVSKRINGRHAFVHERILEFVARETVRHGSVRFNKNDLALSLGCSAHTVDRALARLRRSGALTSTPIYDELGGQLGNEYRATSEGIATVAGFSPERE